MNLIFILEIRPGRLGRRWGENYCCVRRRQRRRRRRSRRRHSGPGPLDVGDGGAHEPGDGRPATDLRVEWNRGTLVHDDKILLNKVTP